MANLVRNGFRWVQNKYAPSTSEPPVMILPVASAFNVVLTRGLPVKLISDGTIEDADPGDAVYGIFDGAAQYYDGTFIRKGGSLPVSTYGSVIQRQSLARVIPVRGQLFRATADDATTFTTLATYIACVGENVEWIAGTAVGDESAAVLDISGHAVTNTLSVRIENIPDRETQDFSATGVSLLVSWNLIQDTGSGAILGT